MKVIQSVQYKENEPVDVKYYEGDDKVRAIAALVMAAADHAAPPFDVVSVRLEF